MCDRAASLFGLVSDSPHLGTALTHTSYANERRHVPDNQRLEFLGDAVLGVCVSQLLYDHFPSADEGTLTRLRAQLVNTDYLAEWGRREGLAEEIRLGKGALSGGLRESNSVIADAVEACIAAAYLDGGLSLAGQACARIVGSALDELEGGGLLRDPKSELQELSQSLGIGLPLYEVVQSGGPAHDKWFEGRGGWGGRWLAQGRGRSKRLAERSAALAVIQQPGLLDSLVEPVPSDVTTGDLPP
jgi:ribonuclease III